MRISDWSSDVCSSDLTPDERAAPIEGQQFARLGIAEIEHMRLRKIVDEEAADRDLRPDIKKDAQRPQPEAPPLQQRDAVGQARHLVPLALQPVAEQPHRRRDHRRSEEHTSELQSLMRTSYAVFCL